VDALDLSSAAYWAYSNWHRGRAKGRQYPPTTPFSVATHEYIGQGKEKAEYQSNVKVYRRG